MSQQGWNRLAAEFESSVCDITSTSRKQIARLVALTRPHRGRTLVDAGCGIGTFVSEFGKPFEKIVAFDFAAAMVRRARSRCSHLQQARWHTLPLEEAGERFGTIADLTVCMNVITSPRATLRKQQWQSLSRLVQTKGFLLVVVPALESAQYVADMDAEAFNGSVATDVDLVRRNDTKQKHYSRAELKSTIAAVGFDVLTIRRVSYPWEEDGLEFSARKSPWDWACVARKYDRPAAAK